MSELQYTVEPGTNLIRPKFSDQTHMKLTRSKIVNIVQGLKALPAGLEPKTRYAVAKDLVLLTRIANETAQRNDELITSLSPVEKSLKPGTPEFEAFQEAYIPFINEEVEIPNLLTFPLDGLKLDVNDLPIGVVNALLPLITVDEAVNTQ